MKKNYFYPETEFVPLKCGVLMGSRETTELPGAGTGGGSTPTGPGLGAPARKIYM